MRSISRNCVVAIAAVVAMCGLSVRVAEAVDGQVLINQSRAGAGGVTPGDDPGFPVTISQSGSYKLSGNLTVPDIDTTAVHITASNVTLDLNGFGIFGPWAGGPNGSGMGIQVDQLFGDKSNITVSNGSVRGMGSNGVVLHGNSHRVEGVYATANGFRGIGVGSASLVKDSISNFNNEWGITAFEGSTVVGNTVNGNNQGNPTVGGGIFVFCPSTVIENTATNNTGVNLGIAGTDCTSAHNTAP